MPDFTRATQFQAAPNEPIETSEIETITYQQGQDQYALAKLASSFTSAIANQVLDTEVQVVDIDDGNTWFLPDNANRDITLKDATGTVYDGYTASFTDKTQYTDASPQGLGTTVVLSWDAMLGAVPNIGTSVHLEFHGSSKVIGAGLSPDKGSLTLPVGHKVEAGAMLVRYKSQTAKLLNK